MACVIKYKGQSIPEEQFLQYLNKQIAINNLFNENETLANSVYEALGFVEKNKFYNKGLTFNENSLKLLNNYFKLNLDKDLIEGGVDYENGQFNITFEILYREYIDTVVDDYANEIVTEIIKDNSPLKDKYTLKIEGKTILIEVKDVSKKDIDFLISNSNEYFTQITPQQKATAQQLYSQYLSTIFPDSKVAEMDNSLYISVLNQLEQENKIEKDCTGAGRLKAEKGLVTSFTKGGKWKVIKDLKGYPTHKEGGVDLTIGKDGVSIKNGNTQFTAKHGLVIPKN